MEKLEFEIESKYENVAFACDRAKEFCMDAGLSENESINVEICLDEALNNVIKHSYKAEPGNKIILKFIRDKEKIAIDIIDFGLSRTGKPKPELDFDPDDIDNLPEGGMGLFIIEQLMDGTNYRVEKERNIFSLIKNLND